MFLKIANMFK